MPKLLHTIRGKLLFTFLAFLLLTGGFLLIADYWFEQQDRQAQRISRLVEDIDLNTQNARRLEYLFLNEEIINENFYSQKISNVLEKRREHIQRIQIDFAALEHSRQFQSKDLLAAIERFKLHHHQHDRIFRKLDSLIRLRGFKGYGYEGAMRNYIHDLEQTTPNLVKILTIRRHEKDFLLRKQSEYIDKWQQAVLNLQNEVSGNQAKLLERYAIAFRQIVTIEQQIGLTNKDGLKHQLAELTRQTEADFAQINQLVSQTVIANKSQNEWARRGVLGIGLLFFIGFSFYVTSLLSRPISSLSATIHQIVASGFRVKPQMPTVRQQDEIGVLAHDVSFLVEKVQASFAEIEEKSQQIERKHEILMNGVAYGKRIQEAILPHQSLAGHFKNHFIVFRPQYDVSGDFYWFVPATTQSAPKVDSPAQRAIAAQSVRSAPALALAEPEISTVGASSYLAVIDCSGKGIGGAFMSMIGYALLNKIITDHPTATPAEILERLHQDLQVSLRQDRQKNEDSMEVCLCQISDSPTDSTTKHIIFAGANRPLMYSQGWEILELPATKRVVGGTDSLDIIPFENHEITLGRNNFLYLTSNGLENQPTQERKPFGRENLKALFRQIIHLPLPEQEQRISQTITELLQAHDAKDDMTIVGVKL